MFLATKYRKIRRSPIEVGELLPQPEVRKHVMIEGFRQHRIIKEITQDHICYRIMNTSKISSSTVLHRCTCCKVVEWSQDMPKVLAQERPPKFVTSKRSASQPSLTNHVDLHGAHPCLREKHLTYPGTGQPPHSQGCPVALKHRTMIELRNPSHHRRTCPTSPESPHPLAVKPRTNLMMRLCRERRLHLGGR